MSSATAIQLFLCAVPFFTATTCVMYMAMLYRDSITSMEKQLIKLLSAYFFAFAFTWFGIISYFFLPDIYLYINAPFTFSILAVPVILYHFIFYLTRSEDKETFSVFHYLFPLIFSLITLGYIWIDTSGSFAWISYSKIPLRLVLSIIYTILVLIRLRRYQHKIKIDPTQNTDISTGWIRWLMAFMVLLLVNALIAASFPLKEALNTVFLPFLVLFTASQMILITFNIVRHNYMLSDPEKVIAKFTKEQDEEFSQELFEAYFRANKPYLDPSLNISDLLGPLKTNRTNFSKFINYTYGMNFRQYINRCRLDELELLKQMPGNKNKPVKDLITKAGFGSYRNYIRIRKENV